ncbi:hypothetical protein BIW11_06653 [Tropilaelaps mercedesae]|uniref:Secreted protein n=1 Tax=Tropilaelaps mercedesae TaxID=418985 RepID=A0A1V9XX40_9ACAR|nr:hypothetical protein BIW11_06653 [Tropilaelaps mercedesae]
MRINMTTGLQATAMILLLTMASIVCVDGCQSYYQRCDRRRRCCSGLSCSRDPGARPDDTYCKRGTAGHNRLTSASAAASYTPYPWWAQYEQRNLLEPVARAAHYPAVEYDDPFQAQQRQEPRQQYYY